MKTKTPSIADSFQANWFKRGLIENANLLKRF